MFFSNFLAEYVNIDGFSIPKLYGLEVHFKNKNTDILDTEDAGLSSHENLIERDCQAIEKAKKTSLRLALKRKDDIKKEKDMKHL